MSPASSPVRSAGMFAVGIVAPAAAAHALDPPASAIWEQPTLELVETRAHRLPPGYALGGAAISADGNRLLAWSVNGAELLVYDQAPDSPRRLPGTHRAAGAAFGDSSSIAVLNINGALSTLALDGSVASGGRVFRASDIRSAVGGVNGWWALTGAVAGNSTELHFAPAGGTSDSTRVLLLLPRPERRFLATAESDALVTLRDPPHTVWRIAADGRVIASMQPDRLSTVLSESEHPSSWKALSAFPLGAGFVQILADVSSDGRVIVTYGARGEPLAHRHLEAPFGFVAVGSVPSRTVVALRTLEHGELVVYSWCWLPCESS